jgi:CBS-domain-containing membrane protein
MIARNIMSSPVISVHGDAAVKDVAALLLKSRISAVAVTKRSGELIGILSESDLMRRFEAGTERRSRWWLNALGGGETAADYTKSHGRKASDVMTRNVISASPDTPLHEIANLMERNDIKRIPIVNNGQLVGIVTRANLIQAVATYSKPLVVPVEDARIREKLLDHLKQRRWAHTGLLNVTVNGGVVELWGMTQSQEERTAIRVAAEGIDGVVAVNDNLTVYPVPATP